MTTSQHHDTKTSTSVWQFTNPTEGFEQAKKEHKPLLLYWGAVWCPPCTELKSNLFAKQEFAELVQQVVTVSLDGDNEIAQRFGEQLKVSSYPTLLLLDQDGREAVRIIEPLSIDEFRSLFQSALLKLKPEKERIAAVLNGRGSDDDFRVLSLADASDMSNHDASMFRKLAENTPARLPRERSLLLLKAVGYAIDKEEGSDATNKEWAVEPLLELLNDEKHSLPAFFSFRANDTKKWLGNLSFKKVEAKWLERTKQQRVDASRSVTSRLWSYLPEFELKAQEMSKERKAQLQNEIVQLFELARGHYERHAATSAVAALLPMVGAEAYARDLLKKALKDPEEKTPWYFEASLAELEAEKGNVSEALKWSEQSRRSARGLATTIQWEAMNIMMNVKLQKKANDHILTLLNDFYERLFAVTDGFSGRNRLYATRVAKALQPELSYYRSAVARFAKKCSVLPGEQKSLCAAYFAEQYSL